jgi:hypothetical protein
MIHYGWWIGLKLDRGLAWRGCLGFEAGLDLLAAKVRKCAERLKLYLIWRGIPRVDVVFSNDLKRAQTSNILG